MGTRKGIRGGLILVLLAVVAVLGVAEGQPEADHAGDASAEMQEADRTGLDVRVLTEGRGVRVAIDRERVEAEDIVTEILVGMFPPPSGRILLQGSNPEVSLDSLVPITNLDIYVRNILGDEVIRANYANREAGELGRELVGAGQGPIRVAIRYGLFEEAGVDPVMGEGVPEAFLENLYFELLPTVVADAATAHALGWVANFEFDGRWMLFDVLKWRSDDLIIYIDTM